MALVGGMFKGNRQSREEPLFAFLHLPRPVVQVAMAGARAAVLGQALSLRTEPSAEVGGAQEEEPGSGTAAELSHGPQLSRAGFVLQERKKLNLLQATVILTSSIIGG